MKKIDFKHVLSGGTFVTNIDTSDYSKANKAIQIFHSTQIKMRLKTDKMAYDCNGSVVKSFFSLHLVRGNFDMSKFWNIYKSIK